MTKSFLLVVLLSGCATSSPYFVDIGPPEEQLVGYLGRNPILQILPKSGDCEKLARQISVTRHPPQPLRFECARISANALLKWRAGNVATNSSDMCSWAVQAIDSPFQCRESP